MKTRIMSILLSVCMAASALQSAGCIVTAKGEEVHADPISVLEVSANEMNQEAGDNEEATEKTDEMDETAENQSDSVSLEAQTEGETEDEYRAVSMSWASNKTTTVEVGEKIRLTVAANDRRNYEWTKSTYDPSTGKMKHSYRE